MTHKVSDGVVQTIQWMAEYSDNGASARRGGEVSLLPPDPASLIPFEDLTEEICLEWVTDALGQDLVSELESNLYDQVQDQLFPEVLNGLPWYV